VSRKKPETVAKQLNNILKKYGLKSSYQYSGYHPAVYLIQKRLEMEKDIQELEEYERVGWHRSTMPREEAKRFLAMCKKDARELDMALLPYFEPKLQTSKTEGKVEYNVKHSVEPLSETTQWIAEELGLTEDGEAKESSTH